MDIVNNVVVTLKREDIQELVKDALKKQGYAIIGDININSRKVTTGYGMAEHDEVVFDSITVNAKKEDNG
jgi:hypothetical protein